MRARDFETDVHLQDLNIQVEKKEMLQVKARILNPPEIRYRNLRGQGEAIEQVAVGKWKINNRFVSTPDIFKWGIIHIGCETTDGIKSIFEEFVRQLPDVGNLFLSSRND